ncbi:MAG: hypothetical protein ACK5MV_04765 [Aminipila sp.]
MIRFIEKTLATYIANSIVLAIAGVSKGFSIGMFVIVSGWSIFAALLMEYFQKEKYNIKICYLNKQVKKYTMSLCKYKIFVCFLGIMFCYILASFKISFLLIAYTFISIAIVPSICAEELIKEIKTNKQL